MSYQRIAVRIKEVFRGKETAWLWKCFPPMQLQRDGWIAKTELRKTSFTYVVTLTAEVDGEPEVYIFSANHNGCIDSHSLLKGSYRGGLSHDLAIIGAGYVPYCVEGLEEGV